MVTVCSRWVWFSMCLRCDSLYTVSRIYLSDFLLSHSLNSAYVTVSGTKPMSSELRSYRLCSVPCDTSMNINAHVHSYLESAVWEWPAAKILTTQVLAKDKYHFIFRFWN